MLEWVRSFSFPGSTPVCGGVFFQDERVQIITHVFGGFFATFVLKALGSIGDN